MTSIAKRHVPRSLASTLAVSLVATAVCAWTALPAHAALIDIQIAPPAPRMERVPPPRRGYVWAPGYWSREGSRWVWVTGHWERARPGHHYIPGRWVGSGKHYHFEAGHWQ